MSEKEIRNVVILGAGFAGLSAAHYYMKHTYPSLKATGDADYRLHIIDQSTHFWWHVSAPRAMVSQQQMSHAKTFTPIRAGFAQYGAATDSITFHQAQPTSIDLNARTVTIKDVSGGSNGGNAYDESTPANTKEMAYYALIIATGTTTPTPLTSFHGSHENSQKALDDMAKRLASATSIIIAGGGPIGVETAGEIGEALNGTAGYFSSRPSKPKAQITLIAGGQRLLSVLRPALAGKAHGMLDRVGVDVVYDAKVTSVSEPANKKAMGEEGMTTVHLDNGTSLTADVYIPATGCVPNTSFLPKSLLNSKSYIETNPTTLRIDAAGPRVYCVGDVGSYTRGGVLEVYSAVPVVGANMARDLGVKGAPSAARVFKGDTGETQVVPVGPNGGVGAFKGWSLPSFGVKMIKGRDYFLSNTANITEGKQYVKA